MPDGSTPEPGGWNRIPLEVEGLVAVVEQVTQQGASFRNDITTGKGGMTDLGEDPARKPRPHSR